MTKGYNMNVLFIGNSYTYYNDMPKIFEALARENGYDVSVDSVTRGGRKLFENLNEDDENHALILSLLKEKEYDVLFIQENSTYPISSPEEFLFGACGVANLISAKRTVLYQTWARENGSQTLVTLNMTKEEMASALIVAYKTAAEEIGAEISPVGEAFMKISPLLQDCSLYAPDLTHPSYLGRAFAAIVHFKTVFAKMPNCYTAINLNCDTLDKVISILNR